MAHTKIVAAGRGPFPLDMLRFLEAWPADQRDTDTIEKSLDPDANTVTRLRVELLTARELGAHSLRRFHSFGWTAEDCHHGTPANN